MAKIKTKITLKEIKEQVILPALANTSFRFRVLTSVGAYEKAYRVGNLRVGTITALLQTTESDIMLLGGGIQAVALNATIRFLVPVNDIEDVEGTYYIIEQFREEITENLSVNGKLTLTLNEGTINAKNFIGAVSTSFPITTDMAIRQHIGNSVEIICYMQFAYVPNALNSSDVQFYLDGDTTPIPYTQYSLSRRNTLTGNLYSNNTFEESKTYAENSAFGVDLSMPALSAGITASAINAYIIGNTKANTTHTLRIARNGNANAYTQTVIFGEVAEAGQGAENVTWQVSFVPYLSAEDEIEG